MRESNGVDEEQRAARTVMRGGVAAAGGFVIRFGARLLFLLIAGRLFGAALFGAYSIAVAVVELAVTIGAVGTKRTLFQFLDDRSSNPGRPAPHAVLDGALLVAASSVAIALVIMLTTAWLPDGLLPASTSRALIVLAPMVGGQALLDLFSASTRWQHLMRYDVVGRSIVEPYVGVVATVLAVWLWRHDDGLLVGYWAGTIAALAYVAMGSRRSFGGFRVASYRIDRTRLVAMLRGTSAVTASDFLNALYGRIDLYLVGALLGEAPAGIYGIARQVRTPIRQVRQSFDGLLIPIVARTLAARGPAQTGQALASASRLILTIQLPVLIVLVAIGVPLLRAIGPGFEAGYWALVYLAAAESVQGAFGLGELIFVYRRPELGLWITGLSTGVGSLLALLLIPWWGITGAGLSVLLSYWLRQLHRRATLWRTFQVRAPLTYHAGPLAAASVGALAAVIVARSVSTPLALYVSVTVVGVAVFGLALWAWVRATGARLAIEGFVADGAPEPPLPAEGA